jgi:MFS family permease
MGTNLGWAIGPALGGGLTRVIPYGAVFYLAAGAMIVAAIVTTRIVDPVRHRAHSEPERVLPVLRSALADPILRLLLAGTFLCALLETQMFSTFSIYMTDRLHVAKSDVGILYAINGAGVLVFQLPALRLIARLGIATTLPWASLIDALGFALIGIGSGVPGAAVAMMTLTTAEVIFDPSHQTAIAELADPAHRGRTYGIVGLTQTFGIALAPLVGGILLDAIGDHHAAMWSVIACFGVGQAACFAAFVRRRASAAPIAIPAAEERPRV